MAEDVKPVVVPVVDTTEVVETPEVKEPVYTATETEAIKYGWKPKDQWEGEADDFRPAKEFMERASFFKKINDLNRKLEQTSGALNAMQQHHNHVYKTSYEQAMKDLKLEHRAAVEAGDPDKADGVLDKMDAKRQEAAQVVKASQIQAPLVQAEFEEFVEKNQTWYGKDEVMTAYADRLGFERANQDVSAGRKPEPAKVLEYVESKVREKFPERFGSQKRAALNPVGPAGSPSRPKSGPSRTEADLPEDAKKVMSQLLKSNVKGMTKERYIKEYFGDERK